MFNNIIQYQFDGNSNLVYTIIRKRQVFHSLANLPTVSWFLKNFKGSTLPLSLSRIVAQLTKHLQREAKNNCLISQYQQYQDNLPWFHQDLLVQLNLPRSCQIHNLLRLLKLPIIRQLQRLNRVVWNWVSWRYCYLVVNSANWVSIESLVSFRFHTLIKSRKSPQHILRKPNWTD